jgi:hypothetical protein
MTRQEKLITGAILLGITGGAFFLLNGFASLNPSNIAWLNYPGHNDPLQHYLGWEFFRHSAWGFPFGASPQYGLDLSSSVVYTDSIPLLAFLFKPFRSWLSEPFQYMGIWYFLCYFLQAYFAWLLAGLFIGTNRIGRFLVAALLIFSPPLLWRVGEQAALAAHFLILAALYLSLTPHQKNRSYWWGALLISAALIQFYILAMIIVLWGGSMVTNATNQHWSRAAIKSTLLELALILAGLLCIFWMAGYFMIHVSQANTHHYGLMPVNLLALIDSGGWSYLLKDIPNKSARVNEHSVMFGTYFESFNYLGLGYLGLLLFAFAGGSIRGFDLVLSILKKNFMLCLTLVFLTCFAISNNIYFGPIQLVNIPLPEIIFELASILRASGRFFWPTYYVLVLGSIYLVSKYYSKTACISILSIALLLQIVDLRPGWNQFAQWAKQPQASVFKTPLENPFWASAAKHYERVEIIPLRTTFQWQENWAALSSYAAKYHLGTNAVFLSRVDLINLNKANERLNQILHSGKYEKGSFYVLSQEKVVPAFLHLNPSEDMIANIDGLIVLAPGWLKCQDCVKIPHALQINSLISPQLNRPLNVADIPGKTRALIFPSGWDKPFLEGIESNSYEGILAIPLPKSGATELLLDLRASSASQKIHQRVEIWVDNKERVKTTVGKKSGTLLSVPINSTDRQRGFISLQFKFLDSVMDRPMDELGNSRFTGVVLRSMSFR